MVNRIRDWSVEKEALTKKRLEDALIDATDSWEYLYIMRDKRAVIYETIVGILRNELNKL